MEFRQPNESMQVNNQLNPQAMLFNGEYIENLVEGYQTLKVKGRETLGYTTSQNNSVEGRDGGITLDMRLKPRTLTVTYKLQSDTDTGLQVAYRDLISALNTDKKDVEISFLDDKNIFYFGKVVDFGAVADWKNDIVSTFTIHCDDGYKYGNLQTLTGNPINFTTTSSFRNRPDLIRLTIGTDTKKVTLKNTITGKQIVLNGNYPAGKVIEIDVKNTTVQTNTGFNLFGDVDYTLSSFSDFTFRGGESLTVTPTDISVSIDYRERWA